MYLSFAAAHDALNIPGCPDTKINYCANNFITSLKIYSDNYSYDKIIRNGLLIHYVGIGLTKGPGHPSANQLWLRQEPFRHSWQSCIIIPVMLMHYDGSVEYMGKYQIKNIIKRIGFEGFTYFHVVLQRCVNPSYNHDVNMSTYSPFKSLKMRS